MSWRTNLYHALAAQLFAAVPSIRWIDVYNSQYKHISDYDPKNTELPFLFPNILIDFSETNYNTNAQQPLTQWGDCTLRIHIGQDKYSDSYYSRPAAGTPTPTTTQADKLQRFDTLDAVHIALQGFSLPNIILQPLYRAEETLDQDHSNVIYDIFTYRVQIIDCSAQDAATPPQTIINPNLHINPDYDNTNGLSHIQTHQEDTINTNNPPPTITTNYIIP